MARTKIIRDSIRKKPTDRMCVWKRTKKWVQIKTKTTTTIAAAK